MGIESDFIWMDGELVPFEQATLHVLSHTLHYGMGVFEGIRSYTQPDGRAGIWMLQEHLERFELSAKMVHYPCPFTREQLLDACLDTLEANKFTSAYLRPLLFLGHGSMGLGARNNPVRVSISSWEWGRYLGDEGIERGVRLKTSSFTRNHPNSVMQRAKIVGHYVNSILARNEANDDGYDEALLLDQNGYVAEGTGENVFVIKGDIIMTPPVLNILPGITRKSVMEILAHEGLRVEEATFARDAFYVADEAFMVGTAAEVTPIREVDRRTVGDGTPGKITKLVQDIYLKAVRGEVDWMKHHITQRS